jgi:YHS domain-containing protein
MAMSVGPPHAIAIGASLGVFDKAWPQVLPELLTDGRVREGFHMTMNLARRFASASLLVVVMLVAFPASAEGGRVNKDGNDVAIKGYDPVAYFTEGQPMKGKAEFEHSWNEATWHFANAEHKTLFARDPEHYAPRYGGFCAGGMALGWVAPVDPEAWVIVDGRLYLNYDKPGRDDFAEDPEPAIAQADANWERLGQTH